LQSQTQVQQLQRDVPAQRATSKLESSPENRFPDPQQDRGTALTEGNTATAKADSSKHHGIQRLSRGDEGTDTRVSGPQSGSQRLSEVSHKVSAGSRYSSQRLSEGDRGSVPSTELQHGDQRLVQGEKEPDFYVGTTQQQQQHQQEVRGEGADADADVVPHRTAEVLLRSRAGESATASRGDATSAAALTAASDPVEVTTYTC
jgi:hypothetical protein